jgi:hypothetical protein
MAELEAGRVPWVQPWGTAAVKAPLAMPRNAATQRRYSGINVLILWGAVIERGFSGQSWLTFRQALGLGGHVRKGEQGTTVVYADRFTPEDERRRAAEAGEEPGAIPFLKRFMDAGAMEDHGRFRVVNEKIKKAQRLRVRLQRRQCLGFSGLLSFVGGEKIDPQSSLGGIAGHAPAIDDVRNGTEGFVDFLQDVEHRRSTISDRNRYVFALGDVDITRLQGTSGEPD